MKKKFFFGMALVALAAYGFSIALADMPSTDLTPLQMQNIEVLSNNESETGKKKDCYNTITSKDGCKVCYCPVCDYVPGTDSSFSFKDTCPK